MRVDQLDLLRLGHPVGDHSRSLEQRGLVGERPGRGEPGEEAGRTLEQRRERGGAGAVVESVERRELDEWPAHDPR